MAPAPHRNDRIALVTCRPHPQISADRDLPVLAASLDAAGADSAIVYWDDPEIDWAGFDLVVIRSTWDYVLHVAEFVAWAERCGALTRLANPAPVVRWNTDKRYLGELAARGVPVVPTRYLPPGAPVDLAEAVGGGEYVIKPTTGAGARFAARYGPGEEATARRQIERMHAEGLTAMAQPYMRGIDTTGERALLYFGGRLGHAVRKGAVLAPGTAYDARKIAHPGVRAWEPTEAELAVAASALAAVPGIPSTPELLYARVDLVDGDDGTPHVMELELVEPNLFLDLHPGSLTTVTEAILAAA
ncbi:RimK family alpha-L-glutamate ligase [Streptomyces sp. NPDC091292]|uniref:ATP-grasp domain-containing protein n=1 Tax=Streptomyces sp. NPDC091292 TaxID=3365991 RepID=UPI0037FFF387